MTAIDEKKRFYVFFKFCSRFCVFSVFLFCSRFYVLTFFLIFQTFFFIFKNVGKVQTGKQINKKHFQNNSNKNVPVACRMT